MPTSSGFPKSVHILRLLQMQSEDNRPAQDAEGFPSHLPLAFPIAMFVVAEAHRLGDQVQGKWLIHNMTEQDYRNAGLYL